MKRVKFKTVQLDRSDRNGLNPNKSENDQNLSDSGFHNGYRTKWFNLNRSK